MFATGQGYERPGMPLDGEGLPSVSHGSVRLPILFKASLAKDCERGGAVLTGSCSSNLMAPDEFRNLGFPDDEKPVAIPKHAGGATSSRTRDDGKKIY